MDNETTQFKELSRADQLSIMGAWLDGKTIQYRPSEREWKDISLPSWSGPNYYRVKPDEPDYIDWSHIDPRFKYMARDEAGQVYLYENEPKVGDVVWKVMGGSFTRVDGIFASYKQGTVGWDKSLVKRPVD